MNSLKTFDYIILFVLCVYFIVFNSEVNDSDISFFIFLNVLIFTRILLIVTRKYGFNSIFVFFIFNFGVFLYSRVFLDFLGFIDFGWADKWNYFEFSNSVKFELLFLLGFSFQFIFIGYNLPIKSSIKPVRLSNLPRLESYAKNIFLLSCPSLIYKYFLQFKFVLANGYLSLYNGSIQSLKYPNWTYGSGFLVEMSFAIFLASMPKKRTYVIYSSIYMFLQILDVLKGGRSKLFLPLMFVLWFYYKFYGKSIRVNLLKLSSYGVALILVSQALLMFRDSNNVAFDSDSFSSLLVYFFQQQGVSILVPGYLIHYRAEFVNESLPYILYPLDLFDKFSEQSLEYIENTLSLGSKLTYFLSAEDYLGGQGIGSSYLAELLDLGYLGVFIGSLVLGFLIKQFDKSIIYSRYLVFLSYILFESIVYMPRASFFPSLRVILGASVFYLVYKLLREKNFEKN
jgi:oligosaccharide repeat unit polymerase